MIVSLSTRQTESVEPRPARVGNSFAAVDAIESVGGRLRLPTAEPLASRFHSFILDDGNSDGDDDSDSKGKVGEAATVSFHKNQGVEFRATKLRFRLPPSSTGSERNGGQVFEKKE